MLTKAIIKSIDRASNRCIVQIPLFQTASSTEPVEVEALFSITPGLFNNFFVDDVVFVSFEENALEKPVVLGKLYIGAGDEQGTQGGAGIFSSLRAKTSASLPATTNFVYPIQLNEIYENLKTPQQIADYIKWLETYSKQSFTQLNDNFKCFKTWTQWQLKAENVEIDDGDLDEKDYVAAIPCQYQDEFGTCEICDKQCTKKLTRQYPAVDTSLVFPSLS